jgi:hypothetical protein
MDPSVFFAEASGTPVPQRAATLIFGGVLGFGERIVTRRP